MVYGNKFFREEFGVKTKTCWLPDVFGYPGSLPTIMNHVEVDYFMTCKLHWQSKEKFPVHLFKWKGLDGSEVLAHIPLLTNFYNGHPYPKIMKADWDNFRQKDIHDEVLFPFGHGDGGGGVTMKMLEYAKRVKNYPGLPKTSMAPAEDYFEKLKDKQDTLQVWDDELYLQTHRGTYTTQNEIKKANRQLEFLLHNYEVLSIVGRRFGVNVSPVELEELWRVLLLHQFHDDLPGSSIREVYDDSLKDMKDVSDKVRTKIDSIICMIADNIDAPLKSTVVFNPLSTPHKGVVEIAEWNSDTVNSVVDENGNAIPCQTTENGNIIFVSNPVEPFATEVYQNSTVKIQKSDSGLKYSELTFENKYFRMELNKNGTIKSLYDLNEDREVIPKNEPANAMELFQDGPDAEAAWNIHDTFEKRQYPMNDDAVIEVVESGPVRIVVRVKQSFRKSTMSQDIIMYADMPRIDFKSDFDWQERQVMLKVAFPVDILSKKATYEIQFGAIERTTHKNQVLDKAKFEVCGHRWIDLSENNYGVSLLNDCKYGFDVKGNKMRITLLRGAEWPDPKADLGHNMLSYSIYPHAGNWTDAQTVQRGFEFNNPLISKIKTSNGENLKKVESLFKVSKANVILDTVKPAEDGNGIILRFYESSGSREKVTVRSGFKIELAEECSGLEFKVDSDMKYNPEQFEFKIKPFELKSFRITGI